MKQDFLRMQNVTGFACALWVTTWAPNGLGQTPGASAAKVPEQAAALIKQVRSGAEGSNAHIEQVAAAIDALGEDGVAVVREGLRALQGPERFDLVCALGRSRGGEPVAGLLMEVMTGDPDEAARSTARNFLAGRTLRRPVLPAEFQALIQGGGDRTDDQRRGLCEGERGLRGYDP